MLWLGDESDHSFFGKIRPSTPFKYLYLSYFLSCFNDQLWAFAMIFMLEHLGSLRLIGVSQLAENALQMLASAFIGGWMNKHSRIYATLSVLAINNLAVTLSASLLITCMKARKWRLQKTGSW
ncbi:unnamed protein product [Bursaphelenchus xylophilus]|uniref:Solute carrier family 40 member n=1 Tax=Bursaphelenchus xylophilus TaxID=6326 RepID=A0A7I8WXB8_BURXY|nr:unnamed protein product [Bursaphelenchus xylophilus]CAG9100206.1 unnamed protein product [Bursaphelenchus xylophilus]